MNKLKIIATAFFVISTGLAQAATPGISLKDIQGLADTIQTAQNAVNTYQATQNKTPVANNQNTRNQEDYSILNKYDVKTPNQCIEHYSLGIPVVVSSERERIERRSFYLCNTGYAVQFDPATKNPIWVAESLTRERLSAPKENRTDNFKQNPFVPGPAQASLTDYRGSGFDRGHMAPAANMYGVSPTAMSESFFLTNMVPQVGPNQNRGIWSDLESSIRYWTKVKGELLVVSGPIYEQGTMTMGKSKVWIPTKLYKVVFDPRTFESIAFIIPNNQIVTKKTRSLDKGNPAYPQTLPENAVSCSPEPCSIANFQVPISQVEDMTGIRFFSLVREDIYSQIRPVVSGSWKMN